MSVSPSAAGETKPPPSRSAAACVARRSATEVHKRDLRSIVGDGAAFSLMVGIGETYLPAFALALGMGAVVAGLIATLPMLAGAVLQLSTPAAVRLLGSHRRWVVVCAGLQAASFLPLVAAAMVGRLSAAALFLVAMIYWGAGMATVPAWNTWVGALIPARLRAPFFARRTRVAQACVLLGFLLGGIALQTFSWLGKPLAAFALLFLTAAVCRFVSARFLARQSESAPRPGGHRDVSPTELLRRCRRGHDGRLLVYLLSVQMAVQIAGPYFTPFMLKQLRFSYATYVTLVAASFIAKAIALPWLGRFAQRFGARRLLWLGGLGIVPISALWLVSQSWPYVLLLQAIGGLVWASYELAMSLLFFESIRADERTSVLTLYNLAHACATVGGALAGAAFLAFFGAHHAAYLALFAISSAARALTLVLLARVPEHLPASDAEVTRILVLQPALARRAAA